MVNERNSQLLNLTADIVTAHVANNSVAATDVPLVIQTVHAALAALGTEQVADVVAPEPAVPVRTSIKPDYIVCLEDGKKLKMLKRHLMAHYNMTPAEYRAKWNLPASYPMVAPNYAETRRAIAKTAGLGRKPAAETSAPTTKPAAPAAKASAPKKAAAKTEAAKADVSPAEVSKPAEAPKKKRAAKATPAAEGAKPARGARRKLGIALKE